MFPTSYDLLAAFAAENVFCPNVSRSGSFLVLLGPSLPYWALLGFSGHYWALLSLT